MRKRHWLTPCFNLELRVLNGPHAGRLIRWGPQVGPVWLNDLGACTRMTLGMAVWAIFPWSAE